MDCVWGVGVLNYLKGMLCVKVFVTGVKTAEIWLDCLMSLDVHGTSRLLSNHLSLVSLISWYLLGGGFTDVLIVSQNNYSIFDSGRKRFTR